MMPRFGSCLPLPILVCRQPWRSDVCRPVTIPWLTQGIRLDLLLVRNSHFWHGRQACLVIKTVICRRKTSLVFLLDFLGHIMLFVDTRISSRLLNLSLLACCWSRSSLLRWCLLRSSTCASFSTTLLCWGRQYSAGSTCTTVARITDNATINQIITAAFDNGTKSLLAKDEYTS